MADQDIDLHASNRSGMPVSAPQPTPNTRVAAAREWPSLPLASTSLLRGASVVQIEHHGTLYLLRSTRQGKLILTK